MVSRWRRRARCSLLTLLFGELFHVELKLLAFKNISIALTSLSWTGSDACKETSRVELISHSWVDHSGLGVSLDFGRDVLGLLFLLLGLGALFKQLFIKLNTIVLKIPRSERIWSN